MDLFQQFSDSLLQWYHIHGRHNLPWQKNPTPYRVWISEIMLQQTQVVTVIPFYEKFIERFPDIKSLALANLDEVLAYWSGLGYYARARHLHNCAQIIHIQYHDYFPQSLSELVQLPGIGSSTAGAILSFGFQHRACILDGNVKRVLIRYHAIEGWSQGKETLKQLWKLANQHTPSKNYVFYNQAIMDLGATLCTRSKPNCNLCPVSSRCQAFNQERITEFPNVKPVKIKKQKKTYFLMIKNQELAILLEKRFPAGIWGGLWSFPECEEEGQIQTWCTQYLNQKILNIEKWSEFGHKFSHFELIICPILVTIDSNSIVGCAPIKVMECSDKFWYKANQPLPGGIPAPIKKLLAILLRGDRI